MAKLHLWLAMLWLPWCGVPTALAQQSERAAESLPSAGHRDAAVVTLRLRGIVQPLRRVVLRAPIAARITDVYVQAGESVEAEQVLVQLDVEPLEQQLATAQAGLDKIRAELRACNAAIAKIDVTTRELREDLQRAQQQLAVLRRSARRSGSAGRVVAGGPGVMRAPLRDDTTEELEDGIEEGSAGRLRIRSSRSRLLSLRQQLQRSEHAAKGATELIRQHIKEATLEANADGVVARLLAQPSASVEAGDELLEVIQTDRVKVVLWLPDQAVRRHFTPLRGQWFARVRVANSQTPWLDAIVRDLAPELHPQTNQAMLELDVDNSAGHLHAGMVLDAILENRPPTPPLPATAAK
jgi:multidrug efflux pump subunit AcrA (membrane-fusion protein)